VSAGWLAALPLVGAVLVALSGVLVLLNRAAFPRYADAYGPAAASVESGSQIGHPGSG